MTVQRKSPFGADVEQFLQTFLIHHQALQNQNKNLEDNANVFIARANDCIKELRRVGRTAEADRMIHNMMLLVDHFRSVQYAMFDAMNRETRVAQVLADELNAVTTKVAPFQGKTKPPQAPAQAPAGTNGTTAAAAPAKEEAPAPSFKPAPPIQEATPKVTEQSEQKTEEKPVTKPLLRGTGQA